MLLHVFMHELGHHHDRTNQKHHGATKGEVYAERFDLDVDGVKRPASA